MEATMRADRGPTVGDPSPARSLHYTSVVTPEGVVLQFRSAGIGSRTLAKFIDLIVQVFAFSALAFMTVFVAVGIGEVGGIILVLVLLFLILYGYPAISEAAWNGMTVGKKVMGLRVITTEGAPVAFRHAAIRSMISTVDFYFPAPGGLIALSAALLTKRSQRLGDLAAGTIVVRTPKSKQQPVFFAPAYGAESFSRLVDTTRLGPQHYTLIREFLVRTTELDPEARFALGAHLADRVAEATGNARPPTLDAERYLVSILFAHQNRFNQGNQALAPPLPVGPPASMPPGQPSPVSPVDLSTLPPPTGPPAGYPGARP